MLRNQMPLVGRWLQKLAVVRLSQVNSLEAVQMLAEVVARSDDRQVCDGALDALRQLDNLEAIDTVCRTWAATRHERLAVLLVEQAWIASAPPAMRLLTALKSGRLDVIQGGGVDIVERLVEACADADPDIAERAGHALGHLENKRAQAAVCRLTIEEDDAALRDAARDAALAGGYAPPDEGERALFFFLTEQWERYDLLDFDRRFLHAAYEEADTDLRQRIREKVRASGRADFLIVLSGEDYRDSVLEMAPGELDLFLQTLIANRKWAMLWDLTFEVSFTWSVRIIGALAESQWRPQDKEDLSIFEELAALARQGLPVEDKQMEQLFVPLFQRARTDESQLFPPAVLRAKARVPGRINDVAFSPNRPVIAVGTGRRKVVLWNYQRAERERVLGDLDRSIGIVTFTGDGALLCAERTNTEDGVCSIYVWDDPWEDAKPFPLGEHTGSVTALEPVGASRVISMGRDSQIILWDVPGRRVLMSRRYARYDGWARTACISPDEQRVAAVGTGIKVMALSQLKNLHPWIGESKARYVAFSPDGETIISGRSNGDVVICKTEERMTTCWDWENQTTYQAERTWLSREGKPLTHHEGWMKGVEMLRDPAVLVSASSDGSIHFTDLENRTPTGRVQVPFGPLTSLHISPDEAFMAVGSADAVLSLWDLRGLAVPGIFLQPFAQSSVTVLASLDDLIENDDLPSQARLALEFVACVLRHRFRYDIEIGELPTIMVGDFDIEVA